MDLRETWELEAEDWVRWARTPGHDAYWYYRAAFFDHVVPPPARLTVEVGCGEGRVVRDLVARGHRVVAVDGSPTLLRHAVGADPGGRYVLADAARIPLGSGGADMAVAYNSLMDMDDMPAVVEEVARVLRPGDAFCICITHPFIDAGDFEGDGDDAPFRLRDRYFGSRPLVAEEHRQGLRMRFRGWSHALQEYFTALGGAGFVVELLREPVPTAPFPDDERWHRYPMFLHLRARRR